MLTRLFALRLAPHGIGVHEIRPGVIRTDMTAPVLDEYQARIDGGLSPIQRPGLPLCRPHRGECGPSMILVPRPV